ncbi:MAG: cupin domain-containing protein [Chloroflexota bacterium]
MPPQKVNFSEKLGLFSEQWTPKLIGEINDHDIKIAKIQGEFTWHHHADSDEYFYVVSGTLLMQFRDGDVTVNTGEIIVVPAGVAHKPVAHDECHIVMIEKRGTVNTGSATDDERTVETLESL